MRITFIRPHMTDARASDSLEPLAFALLAALTPLRRDAFLDEAVEFEPALTAPAVGDLVP